MNKAASEVLQCERDGPIASITLNRPAVMNAISESMIAALEGELDRLAASNAAVILLAGAGRAFCVGSDLKEVTIDHEARLRRMHVLIMRLYSFAKPVVAVLHGHVLGGGLELALGCTFRVAVPSALLGLPEIRLGAIPAYGGTQLLPRLVGEARALEMMLSGQSMTAARAYEIGLVDHVLAEGVDPLAAARLYAERFVARSAAASCAILDVVRQGRDLPLDRALNLEVERVVELTGSEEFRRNLAAFRQAGAATLG